MSLEHWLQLSLTDGIGPILIRRIIDLTGSPERAVSISVPDLQTIEGIGIAKARTIHEALKRAAADVEPQLTLAKQHNATLITPDDDLYPPLLRSITDPPTVLYCQGTLQPRDLNAFAIVGSRRCSHYGREQADRFAALLAGAGFTVTSGGARGIDSAAHRGALQHPMGRTIAVVGSGLDITYPPENKDLFQQISQRGAVLSEFPFGTPPSAENFPRRNRVVSGMSRGVLVIEADLRSGALITARLANEDHNRPVFAIPGRVDNALSAGPHRLIRDGAHLATNLEEILEGLGPLPEGVSQPTLFDPLESHGTPPSPGTPGDASRNSDRPRAGSVRAGAKVPEDSELAEAAPPTQSIDHPRQSQVLSHIGLDPTPVDLIIDRTNLPAPQVLQDLTFLTLRGLVKRLDGQTYIRTGRT